MQSFRRLISSGCLLISAITLLQALFGLTSSHVLLHDKVKRHGEDAAVRKVTELRTENRRLRLLLDNERLRSAMQDHLGQPPPTTANQEATKTTQRSEGCCEGPAVAESAATGQAHVDCMVAPDEQRRRLLSYLDAVMCVTSVCLAATRSRRGLPTASHMVSGRPFVVLTHVLPGEEALLVPFAAATAALRLPTVALVAHMEEAEAAAANISAQLVDEAELAAMRLKLAPGAERMTLSRLVLWTAIEELLRSGVGVLYAAPHAMLLSPPAGSLHADSDVESLSHGWEEDDVRGHIFGSDDPPMGWGRYAESMRAAHLSGELVFLQPTRDAAALAAAMATALAARRGSAWTQRVLRNRQGWQAAEDEQLTYELLSPSHGETARVGASVRALPCRCWLNTRVAQATLLSRLDARPAALLVGRTPHGAAARMRAVGLHYHSAAAPAAVTAAWAAPRGASLPWKAALPWKWQLERTRVDSLMGAPLEWEHSRAHVLTTRCQAPRGDESTRAGRGTPAPAPGTAQAVAGPATVRTRPLRWLVPPEQEEWPVGCTGEKAALCDVVRRVAKRRQVLVTVSNSRILPMLGQFVDIVTKRANCTNFLVVALDNATGAFLAPRGVPHYVKQLTSKDGQDSSETDNHKSSAFKFLILAELLSVGVSVLLSDVDVVFFQDPFLALYGDSDVENMSDGWDDDSVDGHTHELPVAVDDPHGPLRSLRYETRNSGLFYLSATHESQRFVATLAARVASEDIWDQSAWNQESFRLSYGARQAAGVSLRVMHYLCWMNTKVLFKYMRYDVALALPSVHLPVSIHINYHPEKEQRMRSVVAYYFDAQRNALDAWNGGEGQNTSSCVGKVGYLETDPALVPLTAAEVAAGRSSLLADNVIKHGGAWAWERAASVAWRPLPPPPGVGPWYFRAGGVFEGEAANGTWGVVPSQWRKDSLHVQLRGETYLLMFLSEKWSFVADRCADEAISYGRLAQGAVPENRLVW